MSLEIMDDLLGRPERKSQAPAVGDEKPHISPSSINTYTKCPEAWRRRYVMKEKIPPRLSMAQGTALHKGAEFNYKQKIVSRADLPVNEVKDFSAAAFDDEIQSNGYVLGDDEASMGKEKAVGAAKDKAVELAELYAKESAPQYQPLEVEAKVLIVLPSSTHNLLSIADLITEDDGIVEYKTGKKWTQDRADTEPQLTFQAMTFKALYHRDPKKIVIENMVSSTKTPYRNPIETTRTEADYQTMINRINAVLDGINKGVYPPANPMGWWCSEAWCGYWNTCSYVRKRR